ncbi:hypothetical protein HK098_004938 [Nowakowskiella sp. JEL0407]|nr:hypothetical protein HK098_004938 [Nowakowskiella sp. JEL0407]
MSKTLFFSQAKSFAVVGASSDPTKYGNKVLNWYIARGLSVSPINPNSPQIEGLKSYPSLSEIPAIDSSTSVSIITPPQVTDQVIREAFGLGIKNLWMQPGSESANAVKFAVENGMNVIAGGPCILVLGDRALRDAEIASKI